MTKRKRRRSTGRATRKTNEWTFSVPANVFLTVRMRSAQEARRAAARLIHEGMRALLVTRVSPVLRSFGVQYGGRPLGNQTVDEIAERLEVVDLVRPDGTLVTEPKRTRMKRCPKVGPAPERFRCGLWEGHDGAHTALIPSGVPWDPGPCGDAARAREGR